MEIKRMFIGGKWVSAYTQNTRDVINPANEEIIAKVTEGDARDVKKAVEEARYAFYEDETWKNQSASSRGALLFNLADLIEAEAEELAMLETLNNGKPLRESQGDVYAAAAVFRYFAGIVGTPSGQTFNVSPDLHAMTIREPIGVCGLIVPWNYPIVIASTSIAPALAAGNTIVFKPSSITPLSAIKLFELIEKAGFPKGVANLVLGSGNTVGNELASNTDVDKIVFTGGTEVGRDVMKNASSNIKNIALELGGKSPVIIFDDADFDIALEYALFGIFLSQGQICTAGSRLLVQEGIYDRFVDALAKRAAKIKVLPGIHPECEMGPLVSREHMSKVLSYIHEGINEGATLACGGKRIINNSYKGYFVEPTVFIDCRDDMKIVREEIFGPVLVVQKFRDEKEVIKRANDTDFGLAGGVFTKDLARAMRIARGIRAGNIWINTYLEAYPDVPTGVYKQSGIGSIMGVLGLENYTQLKQINIKLENVPFKWFS